MILRLARLAVVDLEGGHGHTLSRDGDEMGESPSGSQSFMSGGSRNAWSRSQGTKVAMPDSSKEPSVSEIQNLIRQAAGVRQRENGLKAYRHSPSCTSNEPARRSGFAALRACRDTLLDAVRGNASIYSR